MLPKKEHPGIKLKLHPRSKHRERYDFNALIETCPELAVFLKLNKYNDPSIDFADPEAVKMINRALLKHFYQIKNWEIPPGYLCPPIPGRADYIHYIADLLAENYEGIIPTGKKIRVLDIGVGANCIYPLIGNKVNGWSFVGSDIDPGALQAAQQIVDSNSGLKESIEFRLQKASNEILKGIIQQGEQFDVTVCNPPFHASAEEANAGAMRKLRNLKGEKKPNPKLNFGGRNNELWCEGGEKAFVLKMVSESREFAKSCLWFTVLISKEANLKAVYAALKKANVADIRTIEMAQGNKKSRIVAWTFSDHVQQQKWVNKPPTS